MRKLLLVTILFGCGGVSDPDGGGPGVDSASPGWDGSGGADSQVDAPLDRDACPLELCNGADDDCDTMVDEDFPALDMACDGSDSDRCTEGVFVCSVDQQVTVCNDSTGDTPELCNGTDDDCDGVNDTTEFGLGSVCDGPGDVDFCADGTMACNGTTMLAECNDPGGSDKAEVCNGMNDDCDGQTDELTCAGGQRCDGAAGCQCDTSSGCGGCCGTGEMCMPGDTLAACGIGGNACSACSVVRADSCVDGACQCGGGLPCPVGNRCCAGGGCCPLGEACCPGGGCAPTVEECP